jgi:gluconate 2-dehydrogenase gamma chain
VRGVNTLTRRSFIAAIGAATVIPGSALLADGALAEGAPAPSGKPYLFFGAAEAQFIECACERLIPADRSGPGAQGAGVPHYLDRQLHGAWGRGERLYRLGSWQGGSPSPECRLSRAPGVLFRTALRAIERDFHADGGKFAQQPAHAQDAYLRLLETGAVDLDGVPSAAFFDMLLKMTVEGFFSNPLYGASRDRIGWRIAGFPGAYAEHSAAERQRGQRDPVESALLVNRHKGYHNAASISS